MLEILYRIYQVASDEAIKKSVDDGLVGFGMFSISKAANTELTMDCCICESREKFKEIIKDAYGNDTRFAYSKKMKEGDIYCVIIGEHCYDAEKYFNHIEYVCDFCGATVKGYLDRRIKLSDSEIKWGLLNQTDKYANLNFCSDRCKSRFIEQEKATFTDDESVNNLWIQKDSFSQKYAGYIYKITKKNTGEFYVGQTTYAPIWRWGQHLKTTRFSIDNILDYKFETIELVQKTDNILEREKYWIQKLYRENPSKSLNISCTQNIDESVV